jgi:hypothetical protein
MSNSGVECISVMWVSGFSSYTLAISEVFTDNSCTIVVIPEVVRGDWSPDTSVFDFNPAFTGISKE